MTWVIGASPYAGGYGVMLSDIQVKLADGTTLDMLQKAYPVGNYIVAGFAGSVRIGFHLLQSLKDSLVLPPDMAAAGGFHPPDVANAWAPVAKRVFEHAPDRERALGSRLLFVGVDPIEDDFVPGRARIYVCRFASPGFHPGISTRRFSVLSIGSGSRVIAHRHALRALLRPSNNGILQFETHPNGIAFGLSLGVSFMLLDHPQPGISPHVHVCTVTREGFQIGTNDRRSYLPDGTMRDFTMPPVARTWEQFCQMVTQLRHTPVSARC